MNYRAAVSTSETCQVFSQLVAPLLNTRFKNLLVVFIFSGLANAIPGLLILFFVEDILQLKELSWLFVLVYFLSSGLAIPLWTRMAKRFGKKMTWQIGMGLAIFSFFWAFFLQFKKIGDKLQGVLKKGSFYMNTDFRPARLSTGCAK